MTESTPNRSGDAERVLESVRRSAQALLGSLSRPPRRLSVTAADVSVELEWTDADDTDHTATPATPGPVVEPEVPGHQVRSPSVGTYYRAPEPGKPPFVREGDVVRVGQQVAIVEAMKLLLPVEADRAGRVVAVLKSDGDGVEYDEPLLVLSPSAEP
jgi:acetyl-CoA carboxylase biotin carboxyl carrier protein